MHKRIQNVSFCGDWRNVHCFPVFLLSMTLVNESCQGAVKQSSLLILHQSSCVALVSSSKIWFLQGCMSDEHSQKHSVPPCGIVPVPGPNEVGAGGGRAGTICAPLCTYRDPTLWGTLSWTHLADVQLLWMVPVTYKSWNTLENLDQAAWGLWFNELNSTREWVLSLADCLIRNYHFQQN